MLPLPILPSPSHHRPIAYPFCPKSLSDNIYVLIESSSWPPVSHPGASTFSSVGSLLWEGRNRGRVFSPGETTRRRASEVSVECVLMFQLLLWMMLWLLGLLMWLRLLMLLVPLWRNCCLLLA